LTSNKAKLALLPYLVGAAIVIGLLVTLWLAFDPTTLEALAWALVGTTMIGIVITSWTTFDSWRELVAIHSIAKGDRVLSAIAFANTRRDVIRVVKLIALFIIAGTVVLGVSSPLLSRSLLVLVIVLMVSNSLLDRLEREQTAEILRQALDSKRHGGTGDD